MKSAAQNRVAGLLAAVWLGLGGVTLAAESHASGLEVSVSVSRPESVAPPTWTIEPLATPEALTWHATSGTFGGDKAAELGPAPLAALADETVVLVLTINF